MILPTKRLSSERALLTVGGQVLELLDDSKTVSRVWDEYKNQLHQNQRNVVVTYDWFILALDLLYALGAVEFRDGKLRKLDQ